MTDEASRFGFSLSHTFSPGDRELEFTLRRKEVTETTEHILAGKKQFLNIPEWGGGTQTALILFCALGVCF